MRCLILLSLSIIQVYATTYYVRTDGNDGNTGTTNSSGGAWLTIAYAETQVSAGDIVRVQNGTYDEKVTIDVDGTDGNEIVFIADGIAQMKGFTLSAADYIQIIGFRIEHDDLTHDDGIEFSGVCTNVDVYDNHLQNVYNNGIRANTQSDTSYIHIRGNTIIDPGYLDGVFDQDGVAGVISNYIKPDTSEGLAATYWLVEYNEIEGPTDFITVFGQYHVVRNNYLHDANPEVSFHADMFQPGSDGVNAGPSSYHVYEANMSGNSVGANGHYGIFQDTDIVGDTDILLRGNIGYNFGSGGFGWKDNSTYGNALNNTFYKITQTTVGRVLIWFKGSGSVDYPDYGSGINNLIEDIGSSTDPLDIQSGTTGGTLSNNLGYNAGSEASYVSTDDPLLGDPDNLDFKIGASSPAIDAGAAFVTITSATGSGTSFDVDRPDRIRDGYGISDGDVVTIGATTTTITDITSSTVTVADSVSWTVNDPLYWGIDTTPDIGALPYDGGNSYTLTATLTLGSPNVVTVSDADICRMVVFYEDGIPQAPDYESPYQYTDGGGVVTAKAYHRYANSSPVVPAIKVGLTTTGNITANSVNL